MSDKKRAVIQIYTQEPPAGVDSLISKAYPTHLVFREEPLTPLFVFESIAGLSQVQGTLNAQLRSLTLSELEMKFYSPYAQSFADLFHKSGVKAGLKTSAHDEICAFAKKYGIGSADQIENCNILFTIDEPLMEESDKVHLVCFPIEHESPSSELLEPNQSYLKYGPLTLDRVGDQRYCCLELDPNFQRTPKLQTMQDLRRVTEC